MYEEEIKNDRKKNVKTEREDENWLTWAEIIKLRRMAKTFARTDRSNPNALRDALILSLYTYIPPRRIKDFALMSIATKKLLNDDVNYCVLEKGKERFIFNVYKTQRTYGQQTIQIPGPLQKIIVEYIQLANLKPGDSLLGLGEGGVINRVSRFFQKNADKSISVNLLRKIFISELNKRVNLTMEEREAFALMMAHSADESLLYKRIEKGRKVLENVEMEGMDLKQLFNGNKLKSRKSKKIKNSSDKTTVI
jgi:hypothetical protein